LPGCGPLIASFAAYAVEKKISKNPDRFGEGAIEGIAAPEAAANASAFTHFIPMLSLGIPAGATMALMLGALLIQGVSPGPQMITQHPEIFWGLIASMWLGNLMLLVLNLPLVGVWIKLLETPYRYIYPVVLVFCMIGIYSERGDSFDFYICAFILAIGWVLERLDCNPAPLVLGLILGPILEENLRRSMLLSGGDPSVFVTRPISAAFLVLTLIVIVLFTLPKARKGESTVTDNVRAEIE
jgi:TctA family transporter